MGCLFMKKLFNQLLQTLKETKKTLWPFRGYICFYWIVGFLFFNEWLNPPKKDDPIFKAEATRDVWNYLNQEVYVASLKLECVIVVLLFFLATSNIKNHPKLAKILLLSPWIYALFNLIEIIFLDILD